MTLLSYHSCSRDASAGVPVVHFDEDIHASGRVGCRMCRLGRRIDKLHGVVLRRHIRMHAIGSLGLSCLKHTSSFTSLGFVAPLTRSYVLDGHKLSTDGMLGTKEGQVFCKVDLEGMTVCQQYTFHWMQSDRRHPISNDHIGSLRRRVVGFTWIVPSVLWRYCELKVGSAGRSWHTNHKISSALVGSQIHEWCMT